MNRPVQASAQGPLQGPLQEPLPGPRSGSLSGPMQAVAAQGPARGPGSHQVQLRIDRLQLPPGTALPPGGLAGLEAAIGEALGLVLQAPPSGAVDAAARPPATLAQAIAEQLRPQLQPHLQPHLQPPRASHGLTGGRP